MNQKLKVVIIGIGIIVSILVTGCIEKPPQNGNSINTSSSAPFFPVQKDPKPAGYMEALLVGELVIEDDCLRVDHDLLVWPHGFSLSIVGEVIQVIDGTGQPMACVGDKVKVSGGEVGTSELPGGYLSELSTQLPSDRCQGPYWIVGEEISVIKR
ncbi:MAG: hypothetical protein U9N36_07125 [Euryarchaeota archaeon]|nr:hypothetical protein [Euryarchaeota archaeon]